MLVGMTKTKKTTTSQKRIPDRASEIPANQGMLDSFREEVMAKFRSHDRRFDSIDRRFDSVDQKLKSHDHHFAAIEEKLKSHDDRFNSVEKKLKSHDHKFDALKESIDAGFHRVISLVEEQSHRNKVVLDGYQFLYESQELLKERVGGIEQTISDFKKISE